MKSFRTHYDNLQVAETASVEAIKGAYKFLLQKWHPDKNPDNRAEAERISRFLNEAYAVLSDPQRRKEHDQWIKTERAHTAIPPSDDYAHSTSASSVPSSPASIHAALWNPNAAANWSLLFSPVFGAWLHAENWYALGDESKAKHSMYWVYGGILAVLVAIFLPAKDVNAIGIVYLFGWYFSSAKSQAKYVKKQLAGQYEKRKWGKPLGIAVVCFSLFFIITGVVDYNFDSDLKRETALSDVSGVWRANQDGALVTFRLEGKSKSVEIDAQSIPVVIESFDDEDKILAMKVNGDSSMIWTVRQIIDGDGKFHLQLTLHDGTQDELSFVRNQ